jgi:predicted O-methyltransferase YrrM
MSNPIITSKEISEYCMAHSTPIDSVLKELERITYLRTLAPQMLSGQTVGQFMRNLCITSNAKIAIEVGTFTGYGAIHIAKGLPKGGMLHTIEINPEYQSLVKEYIKKAGVSDKITLHLGDAKEVIPKFTNQFDFAYIDAGKEANLDYVKMIISKLNKRGNILVDNTLWSGKVINKENQDSDTVLIHRFNQEILKIPNIWVCILPIRDGVSWIQKLS